MKTIKIQYATLLGVFNFDIWWMLIVVYTKEMVRTFQFVVLIMKCTNVPLISRADGYTRFPAKQCKIYKIYFCNFVDKIYTIGFNIWLIYMK